MSKDLFFRTRRLNIAGLALALTGTMIATVAPVSAGSTTECEYDGGNGRVTVMITGSGGTQISRDAQGRILVDLAWCDRDATVQNTDRITILAGEGDQGVDIWLREGGFKPGLTNEPGQSDEIEFFVSLGAGFDRLSFTGNDQASDKLRFGGPTQPFTTGAVNLNAGETTGIDADMTLLVGTEAVSVYANDGADHISGAGGAGTVGDFILPMNLYGNNGSDTLIGGTQSDRLHGNAGGDTLKGRASNDYLETTDGVSGNDIANGGTGANDECVTDRGDTEIDC